MKIKFLLMPSAIIISIVIIIWHVWPAWFDENLENSVVNLRADIEVEQENVKKIKDKKYNIDMLTSELQTDSVNRDLVFGYYPVVRKEEDLINKINHMAFGAGLFLNDITVEYGKISDKNDSEKILAIFSAKKEQESNSKIASSSVEDILNAGKLGEKIPGFITANLNVYGDYEQIKTFLQSLYVIGLLNNVQSFDIYKEKDEEENENSKKLTADIKVSFGYVAKKDDSMINLLDEDIFASGSFNLEVLNEKREMIEEKYPNSEIGERGLSNPFTP